MKSDNPFYLKYFFKYIPWVLVGLIIICWPKLSLEITSTTGRAIFLLLTGAIIVYLYSYLRESVYYFINAYQVRLVKDSFLTVENKTHPFSKKLSYLVAYQDISTVRCVHRLRYRHMEYFFYEIILKKPHPSLGTSIIFFESVYRYFGLAKTITDRATPVYHEIDLKIHDAQQNKP